MKAIFDNGFDVVCDTESRDEPFRAVVSDATREHEQQASDYHRNVARFHDRTCSGWRDTVTAELVD